MKHTVSNHGSIDFLVNNGGGQFMSPLADVRKKGWNAVMDTNLNGTYYCLKHGKMRSVCAKVSNSAMPLLRFIGQMPCINCIFNLFIS